MKKLILVVAAMVSLCSLSAQASGDYEVNDAVYHLNAAMINGDAQALEDLTLATLTYGHPDGSVQNQETFVGNITSGHVVYKRIDLTHAVTTVSGQSAVVREHFSATERLNGRFVEVDLDELMVWQKRDGKWRLVARQGYNY
ncbi:nuclear transport factor 2 family protein [Paraburkholderia phytofirmans]